MGPRVEQKPVVVLLRQEMTFVELELDICLLVSTFFTMSAVCLGKQKKISRLCIRYGETRGALLAQ